MDAQRRNDMERKVNWGAAWYNIVGVPQADPLNHPHSTRKNKQEICKKWLFLIDEKSVREFFTFRGANMRITLLKTQIIKIITILKFLKFSFNDPDKVKKL